MASDLQNPIRFSTHNTSYDVGELLGPHRRVTEIETKPHEGNIYVHWEEVGVESLIERWQEAAEYAEERGNYAEHDGIMGCVDELESKVNQ